DAPRPGSGRGGQSGRMRIQYQAASLATCDWKPVVSRPGGWLLTGEHSRDCSWYRTSARAASHWSDELSLLYLGRGSRTVRTDLEPGGHATGSRKATRSRFRDLSGQCSRQYVINSAALACQI